jgi:diguanylate cyclase (GGDEF)-like protein/PAS domain S-box-containing protein
VSDLTLPIFRRTLPSFKTLVVGRLVALTLLSVLAVAIFGGRFLARQIRQDSTEHLLEAARRVRDGLAAYLQLHEAALSHLSTSARIPAGESLRPAIADAWLEDTSKVYPGFLTLLVTDAEGRIIRAIRRHESSFSPGRDHLSVQDRPYFAEPRRTGKPYISGVFQGRGLGKDPIVAISFPLFDAGGRFAGVVEGSIDLARMPLTLEEVHHLPLVIVYDQVRSVVFSTRPQIHPPLRRWVPSAGETSAVAGTAFTFADEAQQGEPHLAVRLPLSRAGWQVVSSIAVEVVESDINNFYLLAGLTLCLVSSLSWWVAQRMAATVANPIAALAREMQAFDLEKPLAPPGSLVCPAREVAQIDSEFRRLGHRLNTSHRQLRIALTDLDRKVTERTAQLAESETRYRQVVEHSTDIIYRTTPTGVLTFYNEAFAKLTGPVPEGSNLLSFLDPAHRREVRRAAVRQMRGRVPVSSMEFTLQRPSGELCWIGQSTQLLLDDDGQVAGFQAIARDITEQRRAQLAQREAEERYALAVRGSNNGIWDWDLRTGWVYYSQRWREMFGLTPMSPYSTPEAWFALVHPNDIRALRAELGQFLRHKHTELFESEHRIQHADGTWRWVLTSGAAVRDADGRALRIAGSTSDITAGKLVDPLTGLPNRLAAVDRLEQLLARQQHDASRPFALLFMDLDRFKLINDSLGHIKGDHLLLGVSRRLLAALDQVDGATGFVGRLGGDEFVVVLDDAPGGDIAIAVAQAVQREMEAPFHLDGSLLFASTSIGIAVSDPSLDSAEDLLRNADTAMYQAKATGRGKYRLFDSSMHARAVARLALETDLRRALEQEEFLLHYQAQVDLRSGRLDGFEALVRWQHPTRGLLHPVEFIRAAEENGLILPLGRWVLEQGCRQLAAWEAEFPGCRHLSVSINLSALQFTDPKLAGLVAAVLAETGLDPGRLHLEVTESMLADDPAVAHAILNELSAMGVALEVDDFGTGYSCLGQLHQLPFNTLKVDRSFVQAMDQHLDPQQDGRKIVESIVNLSGNLGISVIAEGIETEEHWTQLARLGCDLGQGYYFSRPIAADAALGLVRLRTSEPWPLPASLQSHAPGLLQLHQTLRQTKPARRPTPQTT